MTNTIFHNEEFELRGIRVPEFELKKQMLIRIYVPNFDANYNSLGYGFCVELIRRFKQQKDEFHWAKEYTSKGFFPFRKSMTVKKYLTRKMQIDAKKAQQIIETLNIDANKKVDDLGLGKSKALSIMAKFEKTGCILFDYYGVGAMEIDFLERVLSDEVEKGKSAIGFDRLEYAVDKELYDNIKPIKIKVPNTAQS